MKARLKQFLGKRWFLLALVAVLVVGFAFPGQFSKAAGRVPTDVMVALVLFVMALPLDSRQMVGAMRHPTAVLLAVALSAAVAPLLAWGASLLLRGELASGMLIAGAVPCTLVSAVVWTRRAGGNDAVAILVTLVTNLASVLVVPTWLSLLANTEISGDVVRFGDLVRQMSLSVALPIVLAQIVRRNRKVALAAAGFKTPLGVVAQIGLLIMVFVGANKAGTNLRTAGGSGLSWQDWGLMFAAVAAVHVTLLVAGHQLANWFRLSRPDRIAVGFGGSQKTLPIGLAIALKYFGGLAMLPMIAYHVTQLVIDTLVADRLKEKP